MKTLSKRSIDYMNLYLTMNNMDYITINKHDFKILYSYYNRGIYEINNLQDTLKDREEYCYGLETQLTNLQEENERLRSMLMESIETTNKAIEVINKEIEGSN